MTNRSVAILTVAILFALGPLDSALRSQDAAPAEPRSLGHCSACVFVADGAGDFRAASKALCQAVHEEHLPVSVETFAWSHGYGRILADQIDHSHVLLQGHRLAEHIMAVRAACPHLSINLLGHSAGCAVILTAAESLPPETVQHIVLLEPSVPASYDLRPALHSVQEEMDVFFSREDNWYLRVGMFLTHILQPSQRIAAGHAGFTPVVQSCEYGVQYAKLALYPWEPRLAWTGHCGGHFGCYQQKFLRAFIVPLLNPAKATSDGQAPTEN